MTDSIRSIPDCLAYWCRVCKENCINEVGDPWTEARECQSCYELPSLEQAPEDRILPSLRWAANAVVPASGASAGTPEAAPLTWGVDPEDGAATPPTGGRRRTSGGAVESSDFLKPTGGADD